MANNFEYSSRTKRRRVRKAVNELLTTVYVDTEENRLGEHGETPNNDGAAVNVNNNNELNFDLADESASEMDAMQNIGTILPSNLSIADLGDFRLFNSGVSVNSWGEEYVDASCDFSDDNSRSNSDTEDDVTDNDSSYETSERLANWAVTYNISLSALTALLHILWLAGLNVPKDGRTLLQTRDKMTQIISKAGDCGVLV